MERQNQEHDSEDDDRIRPGKFVHRPDNVDISVDYMCVGKVIYEKQVKIKRSE